MRDQDERQLAMGSFLLQVEGLGEVGGAAEVAPAACLGVNEVALFERGEAFD